MSNIVAAAAGTAYGILNNIEVTTCADCGIPFGAPESFLNARRSDGKSFYCPNGHSLSWRETAEQRLKRELKWERDRGARLSAERDQLQASRRALRGVVTRYRNRVVAGECPVCGQHLRDLGRHVTRQHPDFSDDTAGES